MAAFRLIVILVALLLTAALVGTSATCSAGDGPADPSLTGDADAPADAPAADPVARPEDRPNADPGTPAAQDPPADSPQTDADPDAGERPADAPGPGDAGAVTPPPTPADVAGPASSRPTAPVVIAGEVFELELSLDPDTREQGLMGRTSIADRGGMLFIFPEWGVKQQSFWMKNCLVDMDIIYLARDGTVDSFFTMRAPPPRDPDMSEWDYENFIVDHYSWPSDGEAQFVIEIQAGMAERLGLEIGDRIAIDPALKRRAR